MKEQNEETLESVGQSKQNQHVYDWSPRQGEKKYWTEVVFKEIMVENPPNLAKDINIQIQKSERIPK